MAPLDLYQVDAFTNTVFSGNPAAVCPLESWLPDNILQKIAMENNLSETAFFVSVADRYNLRWFTPNSEVDLCGHATLAASYVIKNFIDTAAEKILFDSASGELIVSMSGDSFTLDFPVWSFQKIDVPQALSDALGLAPQEVYTGPDWVAVYDDPEAVKNLSPSMSGMAVFKEARGIIVTAPGDKDFDFVSRAFFPNLNVPEDPVTGSAHCILTPIWAEKLGKTSFHARQVSARGGNVRCELAGDRVYLTGKGVLYLKGQIHI